MLSTCHQQIGEMQLFKVRVNNIIYVYKKKERPNTLPCGTPHGSCLKSVKSCPIFYMESAQPFLF